MDNAGWIIDRLSEIALLRGAGRDESQDARRFKLYAERLSRFPRAALTVAFDRIEREDDAFFPPLGRILDHVREALIDAGILEPPGNAWRRALRESSRYAPPTRTEISFSSPAVAKAVERLGGFKALLRLDDKGEQITRAKFAQAYREECMSDEHLAFVAAHGSYAHYTPLRAIELPEHERETLRVHAAAHGRALPEFAKPSEESGGYRLSLPEPEAERAALERAFLDEVRAVIAVGTAAIAAGTAAMEGEDE